MLHSDEDLFGDGGDKNENNGTDDSLVPPQVGAARIPNTPEILSALISINPLDTFMSQQRGANSPIDDGDSCSVLSSGLDSPASPPTPKNLRTQLIKEDLKMRLQERRMRNNNLEDMSQQQSQKPESHQRKCGQKQYLPVEARYSSSGCDESSMDTEEDDGNLSNGDVNSNNCELTPEDEERRKRRRERNKLAAMKCRQKKREQTDKLEHESVNLESQNEKMKTNIQQLEGQLRNLKMILQTHKPTCVNPSPEPTPVDNPAHPPSFLPTNSNTADPGIVTNDAANPCMGSNIITELPLSQPSFTPLDLPEFLLTSSAITDDFFTENLTHLPRHGCLFG